MNNYWVGVITGFATAFCFVCPLGFIVNQNMKDIREEVAEIEQRQVELEAWYKENEMVMQTYKFFNQSWQAIIDMQKEENK